MSDEQVELLPCPFCGSPAELSTGTDEDLWSKNQVEYTTVYCSNTDLECAVEPSVAWPTHHSDESGVPMAIVDWNTRAAMQPTPQEWPPYDEGIAEAGEKYLRSVTFDDKHKLPPLF